MDRRWRTLRLGVVASDVLAVVTAHEASAVLLQGVTRSVAFTGRMWLYPVMVTLVALTVVLLNASQDIYRRWALLGGHRVYPKILISATFGLVAIIFLSYFLGGPPVVSRSWLLASWAGTVTLMTLSRLVWRQVALGWRQRGYLVRNVLIAGANQHGIAVAAQLHDPRRHGYRVVGFLDDYQRPGTQVLPGLHVVGHPAKVFECARESGAEEIIIIAGALSWESMRHIAELVTRPDFPLGARISPTFYDLLTTSAELSHVAYVPMLTLLRTRLSGLNAGAKRLLDVSVAATLLAALVPLWAFWRLLAWYRGVPMLKQEDVLGFGGHRFDVVGLSRALTRSPVLARLPALWNVLWQDLSLVGPRPIRASEVGEHDRWLANLIAMRPGLTGLWRLRAGDLPLEERVGLDLYYVRNYTLSLDAQILYNTARLLWRRLLRGTTELARWSRLPRERGRMAARTAVRAVADSPVDEGTQSSSGVEAQR